MDACEPRVRRRGFFLHSSDGSEPDTGEHENPEGFAFASGSVRPALAAPRGSVASGGRSRTEPTGSTTGVPRSDQGA